jgi:hypothetical protein
MILPSQIVYCGYSLFWSPAQPVSQVFPGRGAIRQTGFAHNFLDHWHALFFITPTKRPSSAAQAKGLHGSLSDSTGVDSMTVLGKKLSRNG